MSGASEAAEALRRSALAPYAAAKSVTSHYGLAVARLQAASDLMDVLRASAELRLAAESLGKLAKGHAETVKDALTNAMSDTNVPPFHIKTHTVSLTTKPRTVNVKNAKSVPAHLMTKPHPDLEAIARELRAGRSVPDCELVGNGEPSVRFTPRKDI